ncbi:MAG: protein kinase, partial [Planctomycetota bacterium]
MPKPETTREPVELLAEEFLERRRRGERVSAKDYAAAHPELADEILDLFPTMLALEKLGDDTPAESSVPPTEFEHPAKLGDLKLLREVGRGGMGIVYEAEQESLGRRVAVKILPERALFDTKRLERFRREARTAAALQHPSIVPIYNVGEHEGIHYLTMQLIDGVGLDEVAEHVGSRVKGGAKTAGGSAATEGGSGGAGDLELTRGDGWLADSLARALVEDDFLSAASAELSAPTLADPPETTSGTSHREAPTIALSESEVASASFANDPPPLVADFSTNASSGWSSPNVGNDYYRGVAKLGVQAAEAL